MTPFLIILLSLTVIFGKAVYNWFQIKKQKRFPKHGRQILIVAVLYFAIQFTVVRRIEQWELAGTILMFQACTHWFLFDFILNLMRRKHPLYIGIPDKEDAFTDQFFFKYPSFYVWSKIAMIPFIIYSIVWIFRLWN